MRSSFAVQYSLFGRAELPKIMMIGTLYCILKEGKANDLKAKAKIIFNFDTILYMHTKYEISAQRGL